MTATLLLGWAVAALAACGGLLIFSGWRGRRVNDHPMCARCWFDLIGTATPELGLEIKVCPECGADLLEVGAVQHGLRRRGYWRIAIGAGMVLLAMMTTGVVVVGVVTNVNWNTYKPSWVLEREAVTHGAGLPDDSVLLELMSRRASGSVDAARYRRLAEYAVGRQLDGSQAWSPIWGDLIEDARVRGEVPADLYRQYRINGIGVDLVLGEKADASGTIPYVLRMYPGRLDSRIGISAVLGSTTVVVECGEGKQFVTQTKGGAAFDGWGGGRASIGSELKVLGVPTGRWRTTMTLEVHLRQSGGSPIVATKTARAGGVIEFVGEESGAPDR